jgi:hypothetical protein
MKFIGLILCLLITGCQTAKYPNYGKSNSLAENFIDFSLKNSQLRYCTIAINLTCGHWARNFPGCDVDKIMQDAFYVTKYSGTYACANDLNVSNQRAVSNCNDLYKTKDCLAIWMRDNSTSYIGSYKSEADKEIANRVEIFNKNILIEKQKQVEVNENERNNYIKKTCASLGFKENTQPYQQCTLELYKSTIQIEAIQQAAAVQRESAESYTHALEASNDENKKLREFEASMYLLQESSKLLSPRQPRAQCKYNNLLKTVTCY